MPSVATYLSDGMRTLLLLPIAALCFGLPAARAGDLGDLRRIAEPFNLSAEACHSPLRLKSISCDEGTPLHCNYGAGENVLVAAYDILGGRERATMIVIALQRGKPQVEDFIEAFQVALQTWSAFTTDAQREAALISVRDSILDHKPKTVTLGGVNYEGKFMPEIGLVVTLTRPD